MTTPYAAWGSTSDIQDDTDHERGSEMPSTAIGVFVEDITPTAVATDSAVSGSRRPAA